MAGATTPGDQGATVMAVATTCIAADVWADACKVRRSIRSMIPPPQFQLHHFAGAQVNACYVQHHKHLLVLLLYLCRARTSIPSCLSKPSITNCMCSATAKAPPSFDTSHNIRSKSTQTQHNATQRNATQHYANQTQTQGPTIQGPLHLPCHITCITTTVPSIVSVWESAS